ncbi:MAG: hypothetical protein M3173_09010, partial [Chloroflexota bacterium]|nr:hypothetical protein [Chloroflexota bacterium]
MIENDLPHLNLLMLPSYASHPLATSRRQQGTSWIEDKRERPNVKSRLTVSHLSVNRFAIVLGEVEELQGIHEIPGTFTSTAGTDFASVVPPHPGSNPAGAEPEHLRRMGHVGLLPDHSRQDYHVSVTPQTDARQTARAARLRYISDQTPGIRRVKRGKNYSYVAPDGTTIRDEQELQRIKSLAIPPAWTDVWISPYPKGHIQATGRDEKGRKQYRYHPKWREVRDEAKFDRMIAFGKALPVIREKTEEHLALRGLPREKVLATVVRLLESTLIRVGNDEYARQNRS